MKKEKTYHLAVDLGATSGRTILAAFDGEKVEMEELTRFSHPMLPIGGLLFWNFSELYHQVLLGLKAAADKVAERGAVLSSIGIDSWGCDVAYFRADGTLSGLPLCYRNSSTDGAVGRFAEKMPLDEVYSRTGIQFMDFNTLFQLDTVRRNNPGILDSADKILFIPDALAYMLTGNAVTEFTVASTSQILNQATGDFDNDLLELIGLSRDKFGPMVQPGQVIGTLTPQAREFTGLGDVPVVAVAGHDTASAVVGIPVEGEDYAYLSCGTWSLLGIESPTPIVNAKSREYNFTNEGGIDGTTRFLKNICGLWLLEGCRKDWGSKAPGIADLAAASLESDCDSIIDPDEASFAHPESMTAAICKFCQRTSQPAPVTYGDYVRVIYRSLARRYKAVVDMLAEMSGKEIKRLHVIGGGSQSAPLMQFAADELGIPVIAGPAESTVMGNVLLQLRACGEAPTLADMRKISIASNETKTFKSK